MAVYNSMADGNAQSGLKAGDYVRTPKGGTWQILDANNYKGMTSDQLKAAGVNYNPVNGYYSKLYTGGDQDIIDAIGDYTSYGKYSDKSFLSSWKDNYLNSVLAAKQIEYNNNLANLRKTYHDNYTNYYNQIGSTKNDYAKNIQDLYDSTYLNNAMALQQAANRGMTSAAQGVAMGTSGLMSASQKASQLTSDRDTLISSIQSQLNRLTADYNIDKDILEANFSAAKIAAMSDAQLQYVDRALNLDSQDNDVYNSFMQSALGNKYNSDEAEKERQWNEKMSDKEFERQKELIALEAQYNRSYGGGGYYSYGGSGYSRSGGSSSGDADSSLNYIIDSGKFSTSQINSIMDYVDKHPNASTSQIRNFANNLLAGQSATTPYNLSSTKTSSKNSSNKSSSKSSTHKSSSGTTHGGGGGKISSKTPVGSLWDRIKNVLF